MNFLSEVQGKVGEQLATAVLRWLLVRSQYFREKFIRQISNASRLGPVYASEQFAAFLEDPTTSSAGSRGRVDLLLEIDQWVLGVESKFSALFQEGQPGKYLDTLRERAKKLSELRKNSTYSHAVVILAPHSRTSEVAAHCGDDPHYIPLAWEDVLAITQTSNLDLDGASKAVLSSLKRFVNDEIGFLPSFQDWVPHLNNRWEPFGSPVQRKVVEALWKFFPDGSSRLSNGSVWCGYYFCQNFLKYRGWYGFVDAKNYNIASPHQAELIIATNFDFEVAHEAFTPIKNFYQNFLNGFKPVYAWVIDFDENWANIQRWEEALACIRKTVDKLEVPV